MAQAIPIVTTAVQVAGAVSSARAANLQAQGEANALSADAASKEQAARREDIAAAQAAEDARRELNLVLNAQEVARAATGGLGTPTAEALFEQSRKEGFALEARRVLGIRFAQQGLFQEAADARAAVGPTLQAGRLQAFGLLARGVAPLVPTSFASPKQRAKTRGSSVPTG